MKKVGIIGCGVMGGALAKAIAKKIDSRNMLLFDVSSDRLQALANEISATTSASALELAQQSDYLLIAVKPIHVPALLQEIAPVYFTKEPVLISIVAGLTIERIETSGILTAYQSFSAEQTLKSHPGSIQAANDAKRKKPRIPVIRLMPNVNALVEEGMIALSHNDAVTEEEKHFVLDILEKAGKTEVVSENLFDGVTAISGSGPAYAFLFIEALADAAVLFGIPRDQAYIYAAQTLKGSAEMVLKTGTQPAVLKDAVCSPGGTTIEGVKELEQNGFRAAVFAAAEAAYKKSMALGAK